MEENFDNFIKIKAIIKSFLISIVLTVGFIFILSIFLCYSNVSEKIVDSALIFIAAISILFGTFFMEKRIKEKGLIYGSLFGIIYMAILYLISSFISADFTIGIGSLVMMIFGIVAGCLGGIIGVNFVKQK